MGFKPLDTTDLSHIVPNVEAPNISQAQELFHVHSVSEMLCQYGILKINLGFDDNKSQYLEQLLLSLHQHHGHRLPIAHSASKGGLWYVLLTTTSFQTANCQACSETMDEFPWHTDFSYENPLPRYFALHVLQPDLKLRRRYAFRDECAAAKLRKPPRHRW